MEHLNDFSTAIVLYSASPCLFDIFLSSSLGNFFCEFVIFFKVFVEQIGKNKNFNYDVDNYFGVNTDIISPLSFR